MGIAYGSEQVGGLAIGSELVGGRAIGSEVIFRRGAAPTPSYPRITGRTSGSSSNPVFTYSEDIILDGVNYGRPNITQRLSSSLRDLTWVFSTTSRASQFIAHSPAFDFRFDPSTNRYANILAAQTGSTIEWDIVSLAASTDYTLIFEALPAPLALPVSIPIAAVTLNAVAAGVLSPSTVLVRLSIDGTDHTITSIFTHGNGHQIRFASAAQARAFVAADVTVDPGIAGQGTYKSSQMTVVDRILAAQYVAYPGRYQGGQNYTVTISE